MLPGHTNFIMGASGAGKTTLLNALSGRVRQDRDCTLTGESKLNDTIPLNQESFARYGAYVMQDDILFEYFTVREALKFAVKLKLNLTEEEREVRVDQVLAELGLVGC